MTCECRTLMHADSPCRNRGPYESVMRPVRISFLFWTWNVYKWIRVCSWCLLTGDVRIREGE